MWLRSARAACSRAALLVNQPQGCSGFLDGCLGSRSSPDLNATDVMAGARTASRILATAAHEPGNEDPARARADPTPLGDEMASAGTPGERPALSLEARRVVQCILDLLSREAERVTLSRTDLKVGGRTRSGEQMAMLLSEFAKRVIREGDLTIIDAAGRRHRVGDGRGAAPAIRLHDRSLHRRLAINPFLHLGEAYMDGTLTMEQGSLYDFLDICAANVRHMGAHPLTRAIEWLDHLLRRVHQYNPMHRAQANVAHHYDLSDTLYDLFLDADRQYSCAYFTHDHDDLEQAQQDKKRHLAAKLLLKPGMRVLDIGSGWGGLGLYLAEAGAGRWSASRFPRSS